MYLGEFKIGETVFIPADFHDPATGDILDPTSPVARMRDPSGTFSTLATPTKQDTTDGFFGTTVVTTGFTPGQYVVNFSGTVGTGIIQAVPKTFILRSLVAEGIPLAITGDLTAVKNTTSACASLGDAIKQTNANIVCQNLVGATADPANFDVSYSAVVPVGEAIEVYYREIGCAFSASSGLQTYSRDGGELGTYTNAGWVANAGFTAAIEADCYKFRIRPSAAAVPAGNLTLTFTRDGKEEMLTYAIPEVGIGEDYNILSSVHGNDIHHDRNTLAGPIANYTKIESVTDTDIADIAVANRTEMDANSVDLDAIQAAIAGIGSGTGSASNAVPTVSSNETNPLQGVTLVGTIVGGVANVWADDGTRQVVTNTSGNIDMVYKFVLGASQKATQVSLDGFFQVTAPAAGKTILARAYNFSPSVLGWQTRKIIDGQTSATDGVFDIKLLPEHTGFGANAGEVYIRFTSTGVANSSLNVDTLLGSVAGAIGDYADGAVWVDNDGQSGQVPFVNGTTGNPCPWSDAIVVAAAVGLERFRITNDQTITLDASAANYSLVGDHWYLEMGGQSINDGYIKGAAITGIGTATSHVNFEDCTIGAATIPPGNYYRCGLGEDSGTLTAGSNGEYVFIDCYSMVPGSGTPVFDFATNITATSGFNFRRWSGGSNITMDSFGTVSMEVVGGGGQTVVTGGGDYELRGTFRAATITSSAGTLAQVVGTMGNVTVNGTAGEVRVYGVATAITDNSAGAVTIVDGVKIVEVADSISTIASDSALLVKLVKNKKEIKKVGAVWYLIVYDDGETDVEILRKALKNSAGGNISDISAGAIAQELSTSV